MHMYILYLHEMKQKPGNVFVSSHKPTHTYTRIGNTRQKQYLIDCHVDV